jgi:purine catabolism regulator
VVALVLARERAVRETERRLAGEVVSLVLDRQTEAAAARMTSYGIDPAGPLLPVVCAVGDREGALAAAEGWLEEQDVDGVVALRADELVVVVAADVDPVPLAEGLVRAIGALAAGVGTVANGSADLRRSLVRARQACELGRRRGAGVVVSHELTGSHSLLLALQDQDVVDSFRDSLLAPLEEHDAAHGTDLLGTLEEFLTSGGRWQDTADQLHLHVNSLRNRLARVEALTGRRLDTTAGRVDLWLALQARRQS